jgi:hypothetical protein
MAFCPIAMPLALRARHLRVMLDGQPVEVLDAGSAAFVTAACAGAVAVQIAFDAPVRDSIVRDARTGSRSALQEHPCAPVGL